MKTNKLLKLVFTFFATVAVSAAFAQVPFADMTAIQTDGTDSVTVNKKMVYFVEPDPVLNSLGATTYDTSWTQAEAQTNGVNSTFGFVWEGSGTGSGDINTPDNWTEAPYRVVNFTGTGDLTLQATESTAGGCPGTTTDLNIEVIGAPQFTVGGPATSTLCHSAGLTDNVAISVYDVMDAVGGQVYFRMDIDVYTDSNGDSNFDNLIRTETDTIVKVANPGGTPSTTVLQDYYVGAQSGAPTRYRFDFGNTIDAADNNGLNDYISRKSDYFENGFDTGAPADGDFTYYAAADVADADKVVEFIVYPAPNTGDIYYIPNGQYNP